MNANIVSKPLACKAWAILVTCLFIGGITGSASAPVSAQPAQQMDVPAEPVEQAQA